MSAARLRTTRPRLVDRTTTPRDEALTDVVQTVDQWLGKAVALQDENGADVVLRANMTTRKIEVLIDGAWEAF